MIWRVDDPILVWEVTPFGGIEVVLVDVVEKAILTELMSSIQICCCRVFTLDATIIV